MRWVIGLIALSSLSLTFAAFGGGSSSTGIWITVIPGIVFWGCLVAGYVLLFIISRHRRDYEKNEKRAGKHTRKPIPGIITFFSSPTATLVDIAMIVVFVLTLVFAFIPDFNQKVLVVIIAVLIFLVQAHCILNGVNFKYIMRIADSKR